MESPIALYTIDRFTNEETKGVNIDEYLNDDIIKIINRLASLVGAPEYQKTPVFKKRTEGRRREQTRTITAEDWETMRNFKATKLKKNEDGIEKSIDELRMLLNKIIQKNYDDIHDKIIELLKKILDDNAEEAELMKVGASIFEIGSMNKFWAKLYAKLYKDIIDIFPVMHSIYEKNLESFLQLFEDIKYVSSEVDYDAFCLNNKENFRRRSMSSFLVHLMNNDVIEVDRIGNIVLSLIEKFENMFENEENKNIVDEIGENICILVKESGDRLVDEFDSYGKIDTFVHSIADIDYRKKAGLSSKIVFKFMDIIE